MATTPNQKPVPSEDYANMRFNAGKFDEFITSTASSYVDRLGITHLTVNGIQASVAGALLPANNLSDVQSAATSRANLGATTIGSNVFTATTAVNARNAILAAVRGANNDITSMSGLTTPISVAQGGTGVSDISYVRAEDSTSVSVNLTTFVKLTPNEISDLKNEYSAGNFTPAASGYYHVIGSARMDAATSNTAFMMLKIDSSSTPTNAAVPGQTATAYAYNSSNLLQVSCVIYIAAGSSISLYVYHNDSSAKNIVIKSIQAIRLS